MDSDLTALPDLQLASAAATGERSAFEELYRRNVPAAWRVAQAVAHNPDDASDAVADAFERVFRAVSSGRLTESRGFRQYLLTTTRRAAIDISRRSCRTGPTDEIERLAGAAEAAGPSDQAVAGAEASLVARAFRELPERWRSVLWLIEVERLSAREAASVLEETPNNVAQLAVRARRGLRKRYLAAYVRDNARPECRVVIDRLGPYIDGTLGHCRAARVEHHLAGCAACRRRRDELRELGTTLRRSALPIPVALGALAAAERWFSAVPAPRLIARAWLGPLRHVPAKIAGGEPAPLGWLSNFTPAISGSAPAIERVVSWAAASVLVLGVSAGVVRTGAVSPGESSPPTPAATADADPGTSGTAFGGVGGYAHPGPTGPVAGIQAGGTGGSGAPPPAGRAAPPGVVAASTAPPLDAPPPLEAVTSIVPPIAPVGNLLSPEGTIASVLSPLTGDGHLPVSAPVVETPVVAPGGAAVPPVTDVGSVVPPVPVPVPVPPAKEVIPDPTGALPALPVPGLTPPDSSGTGSTSTGEPKD